MAQKEDTKTSQANKVLRLWPSHFTGYCSFWTTLSESDLQAFQGATGKDLKKLVTKEPGKKRSIEASLIHAQIGQNTIKCGALIDTMAHVVDEATSQATSMLWGAQFQSRFHCHHPRGSHSQAYTVSRSSCRWNAGPLAYFLPFWQKITKDTGYWTLSRTVS